MCVGFELGTPDTDEYTELWQSTSSKLMLNE